MAGVRFGVVSLSDSIMMGLLLSFGATLMGLLSFSLVVCRGMSSGVCGCGVGSVVGVGISNSCSAYGG